MTARKSTATKAKKHGLRAALAAKQVRTSYYDIPVVSSGEADRAGERLTRAKGQLELARLRKEPEVIAVCQTAYDEAKAERDGCFHRVVFAPLGPNEWDRFLTEHTAAADKDADDEAKKEADERFFFALVARAVVDGDGMTAEEWRGELSDEKRWPAADVLAFRRVVFSSQDRDFSDGIPKD